MAETVKHDRPASETRVRKSKQNTSPGAGLNCAKWQRNRWGMLGSDQRKTKRMKLAPANKKLGTSRCRSLSQKQVTFPTSGGQRGSW